MNDDVVHTWTWTSRPYCTAWCSTRSASSGGCGPTWRPRLPSRGSTSISSPSGQASTEDRTGE